MKITTNGWKNYLKASRGQICNHVVLYIKMMDFVCSKSRAKCKWSYLYMQPAADTWIWRPPSKFTHQPTSRPPSAWRQNRKFSCPRHITVLFVKKNITTFSMSRSVCISPNPVPSWWMIVQLSLEQMMQRLYDLFYCIRSKPHYKIQCFTSSNWILR